MSAAGHRAASSWQLSVLRAGWLAGVIATVETALLAARATLAPSAVLAAWAVLQAFCFYPALLLIVTLHAARATLGALELRWRPPSARALGVEEAWFATAVVVPVSFTGLWLVTLWHVRHFKNQELLSLSAALAAMLLLALSALIWVWAAARAGALLHQRPARLAQTTFLTLLVVASWALALAVLLGVQSSGLRQLDPALLTLPLAGFAAAILRPRRAWLTSLPPRLSAGLLVGSLAAAAIATHEAPSLFANIARFGTWSGPMLRSLRSLSDVDGDGYSGLLAGGDCAAFDQRVHPGALEVAEDGLDNNCAGGDGERANWPPPQVSRSRPQLRSRLNFVLLTIETLRADHVSFLGYHRPTTPRLEALAREAFVFERFYAAAPNTRLSLAALLSGRLPSRVAWQPQAPAKQMRKIGASTPWLPEVLAENGYATVAVHTNFRAFTEVESAGFERGFQRYDTTTELSYVGGTLRGFPGGAQVDRALSLLDETAQRPWFLWLHLMEPHYLYEQSPAGPRFGDDERALYDADIAEADRQVGRLLDGLSARGMWDDTLLLVCGDHGEEFGEHGARWHGSNLYEPQLRSAALLRVPGLAGRRLASPVVLTDFTPTALDILGVTQGFERWEGRNLLGWMAGGPAASGALFFENFKVDTGEHALFGMLAWPHKLIYSAEGARFELYDLVSDPLERHNLQARDDARSHALSEQLMQVMERARPSLQ